MTIKITLCRTELEPEVSKNYSLAVSADVIKYICDYFEIDTLLTLRFRLYLSIISQCEMGLTTITIVMKYHLTKPKWQNRCSSGTSG